MASSTYSLGGTTGGLVMSPGTGTSSIYPTVSNLGVPGNHAVDDSYYNYPAVDARLEYILTLERKLQRIEFMIEELLTEKRALAKLKQ